MGIILGTVLRAAGDTKTPMKVGCLINLINIILNYFLIYETRTVSFGSLSFLMPGAGLGIIGAAAASAIAYTYGGVAIFFRLYRHQTVSAARAEPAAPAPEILRPLHAHCFSKYAAAFCNLPWLRCLCFHDQLLG